MKKSNHAIWFAPLLCVLGCASSAPPEAKNSPPETTTSTDNMNPEMAGGYGKAPEEQSAKEEEKTAPSDPPQLSPAPTPVVAYRIIVNDLIDPPASRAFDAVVAAVRKKEWSQASTALKKILPAIDEKGLIHEKIVAHALAGRIAEKLKNAKKADEEYQAVLVFEKDQGAVSAAIQASDGSEEDKLVQQQFAAYGVGEAQFHFADKSGREADALTMPKYQGSGDKDEVLKFTNEKISGWIKAKRPKIESAQAQYTKILDQQPAPHPRWVIAGSTRVGQMWWKFVEDFRNAPMPKAWLQDGPIPGTDLTYGELRTEFKAKIIEASEPQFEMTRQAFRVCSDYATKFKIENDDSKHCQAWLAAHPVTK